MAPEGDSAGFRPSQQEGLEGRRADQDRTLAAMHRLEEALGSAAPRREAAWRQDVLAALRVLDEATAVEQENAARPDSLLSDIKRAQSRLSPRVRGVQAQYAQLRDQIAALRRELDGNTEPDYTDVRQRLASLLGALRYQRARESDLIYEAYYEAFDTELGRDG